MKEIIVSILVIGLLLNTTLIAVSEKEVIEETSPDIGELLSPISPSPSYDIE